MTYKILNGNNLDILPTLPDNSVDAIVTDPPYGLSNMTPEKINEALTKWLAGERDYLPEGKGFMGKAWDSFVPPPAVWDECLRVLKPGGHLLAFFGSRTMDIGALSIRLAGFEIRDSVAWLYGSGFPKSLDISKAIDKQAGYQGEVIGTEVVDIGMQGGSSPAGRETKLAEREIREPSPQAQQWQGWGTALKPAFEPVIVARKPITTTVAENVLTYGTGGLNIDGSRIGTETISTHNAPKGTFAGGEQDRGSDTSSYKSHTGRWPANVILDEHTAGLLDEQSGQSKSPKTYTRNTGTLEGERVAYANIGEPAGTSSLNYGDTGGASRFFYVAKASKRDRNEGLDELPDQKSQHDAGGIGRQISVEKRLADGDGINAPKTKNFHPTVKPTDLMRYLVKLITPPGGTVLDPFTGSGSTGKAAILEGFDFIGIEMTAEYLPIIEGRLKHAETQVAERINEAANQEQEKLF